MINREHQPDPNKPPDLLGQIAAETGMTPGALLGRPELAEAPGADLLALAREAEKINPEVGRLMGLIQDRTKNASVIDKEFGIKYLTEINAEAGKIYEAWRCADQISNLGTRIEAFMAVANARDEQALDDVKLLIAGLRPAMMKIRNLRKLYEIDPEPKILDEAEAIFLVLEQDAIDEVIDLGRKEMAELYGLAGEFDKGRRMAENIVEVIDKNSAFFDLVNKGDGESLPRLEQAVKSSFNLDYAILDYINGLLKFGQTEQAKIEMADMQDIEMQIAAEIAIAKHGSVEDVALAAAHAAELGRFASPSLFFNLADAGWPGALDRAHAAAENMGDARLKISALTKLAERGYPGAAQEAEVAIGQAKNSNRTRLYSALAKAILVAEKGAKA